MPHQPAPRVRTSSVEWLTLGLWVATLALWLAGTSWLSDLYLPLGILATALAIAQYSSLQHEFLHGHPFHQAWANEALGFLALGLTVPYGRFRDTHLAHHHDPALTDPYDDPESYYMEPAVWDRLPRWQRGLLLANNTMLGRVLLGPWLGLVTWYRAEWRLIRAGDAQVRRDWLLHLAGLVPVIAWLVWAGFPPWALLLAAWAGHGLLKIRTFLEHRAHELARARSVIVEDRGPLALLFLNNNLHAVHHMHPAVPWYRLPALYRGNRDHYLRRNGGYRYDSYAEVIRRHLLRRKEPVAHPIWPLNRDPTGPAPGQDP